MIVFIPPDLIEVSSRVTCSGRLIMNLVHRFGQLRVLHDQQKRTQ